LFPPGILGVLEGEVLLAEYFGPQLILFDGEK
jgi:hypothetical protein